MEKLSYDICVLMNEIVTLLEYFKGGLREIGAENLFNLNEFRDGFCWVIDINICKYVHYIYFLNLVLKVCEILFNVVPPKKLLTLKGFPISFLASFSAPCLLFRFFYRSAPF